MVGKQDWGNRSGAIWASVVVATVTVSAIGIAVVRYAFALPTAEDVSAGKVLFEHEFTTNDPLCGNGDGLGPVFNEKSCVACHFQGGVGGSGPNEFNVTSFEVFPVPGRPEIVAGGIHAFATSEADVESVEALQEMFPNVPGASKVVSAIGRNQYACAVRLG